MSELEMSPAVVAFFHLISEQLDADVPDLTVKPVGSRKVANASYTFPARDVYNSVSTLG